MPPENFKCKQCGNCCLHLTDAANSCATGADIRRWEEAGRDDILDWVDTLQLGQYDCVHDIWVNPRTGEDAARCPWLRKERGKNTYVCRIYDMRPDLCRNYPKSRQHAEDTGCPGFD
ncbi:MAG: YkgJ family cysteine cluster protein [Lentisphaeria bacterium]|nr:YkgJ family cysteine cluster protein [Lentisphaeria bacterium]